MNAHHVSGVEVCDDQLRVVVDGKSLVFSLAAVSPRLARATPAERRLFEVSPSGYGIHWPLVDEDLSIDGLLGVEHRPRRKSALGSDAPEVRR